MLQVKGLKEYLNVLAIYGHGGHLGHVAETIFTKPYVPSSVYNIEDANLEILLYQDVPVMS